jgi:hypothetical protein
MSANDLKRIGNFTFRTQKDLNETLTEIRESLKCFYRNSQEYKLLEYVFLINFSAVYDVENIEYFYSKKDNNGFRMIAVTTDKQSIPFKTSKITLNTESLHRTRINNYFRRHIRNQIEDYRKNINDFDCFCRHCQKTLTKKEMEIDHLFFFKDIVRDFMDSNKHLDFKRFEPTKGFEDKKIIEMFKGFHRDYAILRPLCKKCNSNRNKIL